VRFWVVVGCVAALTMAIRATGPLLFANRKLPSWAEGPFALLTPVVLAGLAMVATFGHGRELVLDARAAGVGTAVILVLLRVPILAVMVAAAGVTAIVRVVT
jgi:hypothetical protein